MDIPSIRNHSLATLGVAAAFTGFAVGVAAAILSLVPGRPATFIQQGIKVKDLGAIATVAGAGALVVGLGATGVALITGDTVRSKLASHKDKKDGSPVDVGDDGAASVDIKAIVERHANTDHIQFQRIPPETYSLYKYIPNDLPKHLMPYLISQKELEGSKKFVVFYNSTMQEYSYHTLDGRNSSFHLIDLTTLNFDPDAS